MPHCLSTWSCIASRRTSRSTRWGEILRTALSPALVRSSRVVLMFPPSSGCTSASSADSPAQRWTIRRSVCQEMSLALVDIAEAPGSSHIRRETTTTNTGSGLKNAAPINGGGDCYTSSRVAHRIAPMQRTLRRAQQQSSLSPPTCGARGVMLPLLLTLILTLGCNSAPTEPVAITERASVDAIKKSVEYLASDDMEGRGIGTEGLELAAKYIAGYFGGLGLQPPPGKEDYFQSFEHSAIAGIGDGTKLSVNDKAYQAGEDFQPQAMSAEKGFSGGVVFVGYGISGAKGLTGEDYDDYAGVDVSGKVVLAL